MKYFLFIVVIFLTGQSYAQMHTDSLLINHPYFNFKGEPVRLFIEERNPGNDEGTFYFIIGLVTYIAIMRLVFYKYISTMFTLFFRATLRQQQLREQMLQAKLPSLLINIFFVFVFATYCALVAQHFDLPAARNFWGTMLWATLIIAGIYIGKSIILNLLGWIFGISNASDTYLFIVFLVNKMLAIFLLPFVILLAFPTSWLMPIVLTLSYILVAGTFLYRFIISYRPVRSEIKLTRLQFFLYLCAFEIAPLLLIYKVLLTFEVSRL